VISRVILSERASNLHWKLVYLSEHPQWEGEGILVGKTEKQMIVQIPSLALESTLALKETLPLNSSLTLQVEDIDIPSQQVLFRVRD